jgi:hypothetical protein
VFGRNLKYQPVRKWTSERNAIGHTHARLKQAGVGSNGILECKLMFKTEHRACTVSSCWTKRSCVEAFSVWT